jgi:purine-binding chemotaxis protein CheW
MDLSARFARESTPVTKSSCIVIAEIETAQSKVRQNMGIVVDAVQAVLEIPSSDIESPPNFGARIHSDFIEGIAKVSGKFVIVLDVHHTLSFEGIGEVCEVEAPADLVLA